MRSSSTTRPGRAAITTTRCDRNTASRMLCVTNITVRSRAAHSCSRPLSSRLRVISSSAPKGSSISSSFGRVTRPRAMLTRICWPPLDSRGRTFSSFSRPSGRSTSRTRGSLSARGTPARSSGRRTLAITRAQGIRVASWNTKLRA
ncbi:MAG: hypothetical protein RL227_2179 [Pseudomonadota bacterium]